MRYGRITEMTVELGGEFCKPLHCDNVKTVTFQYHPVTCKNVSLVLGDIVEGPEVDHTICIEPFRLTQLLLKPAITFLVPSLLDK